MKYLLFIPIITFFLSCTNKVANIEEATTIEQIKAIYEENPSSIINDEFTKSSIESKLDQLCDTEDKVNEVKQWYKHGKEYLNIIIVPDLSNRVITLDQTKERDISIINHIYQIFYDFTAYEGGNKATVQKQKTFDRIIIDVSDKNQGSGRFNQIANELMIDLQKSQGITMNMDIIRKHKSSIDSKLNQLYDLGILQNTNANGSAGADFYSYIDSELRNKTPKSTVSVSYKNYLFILTDGYLETSDGRYYTKGSAERQNFIQKIASGTDETTALEESNLVIPPCNDVDLSNWNIAVMESRERDRGDIKALQASWTNWFKAMKCKNIMFQPYTNQIDITNQSVSSFIKL